MIRFPTILFPLVSCISLLSACARLDPVLPGNELVVAIRTSPAFYQKDDEGEHGFHYDLAQEFAESLGMKLKVIPARDSAELIELVKSGKAHFAAALPAGMPIEGLRYTAPLRQSRIVLVHHADTDVSGNLRELAGKPVAVTSNSPVIAFLHKLPADRQPKIEEQSISDEISLMEEVSAKRVPLAIIDSANFDIAANYYPDLRAEVISTESLDLAWAFAEKAESASLFEKARAYIAKTRDEGSLAVIDDRYFGHIHRLNEGDITHFIAQIKSLLPKFQHEFETAQELTGIDWRLFAALAYQESKWDPEATSPTGVRGLMMLTEDTADQLNVANRLDPSESIRAGCLYLSELNDSLPETVKEPDRTWLALAAYNLGMGHMNGARSIAESMSRDPDSWYEMKRVLPLLARPQFYARLKSGRARGGEAVIMVENIRNYYDILTRFTPTYRPLAKKADDNKFTLLRSGAELHASAQ